MPLRPFAVLGFAAFAAAVAAVYVGPAGSMALAVAFGVLGLAVTGAGIFSLCRRGKLPAGVRRVLAKAPALAMVCLTGALILCRYSLAWNEQAAPVRELDGTKANVHMLLLDYPEERYNRYYYQARVYIMDGERVAPFTIRLSSAEPIYGNPYDFVCAGISFYRFRSGGLYSSENAQLAAGNVLGAYLSDYNTQNYICIDPPPMDQFAADLRYRVGRGIDRYLPEQEAGLVRAILLGQRSALAETVNTDFARTGTAHLMAISGLHMTALAFMVAFLVGLIPVGIGTKSLLSGLTLLSYLWMIGFPASAVRSGIMFMILLLGQALGRRPDSLNSLGAAALVICLARPFAGGDLGLALSLGATAGIILLYRPLMRAFSRPLEAVPGLKRLLRPVCASFAVTAAVTAFTLPVQVEVFGGFSLLTPLANLLLVPMVSVLMYCAIPFAAFAAFPQTAMLARPFAFCAGWMARLVLWTADRLASVPNSWVGIDHTIWALVLGGMLLAMAEMLRTGEQGRRRLAVCMALLLPLGLGWQAWQGRGTVTVALAGEKGSACVLVMKDGHAAALSLGGYNSGTAEARLAAENIRSLDSVFLPVQDQQARAMAADLLDSRPAGCLLLPDGAYVGKDLEKTGIPITYLPDGTAWEALPGVEAEFSRDTGQVRFTANGVRVILETGGTAVGGCDLLVTGEAETEVVSPYTLLFVESAQSPETALSRSLMGKVLLVDEQMVVLAKIDPEGKLRLSAGE